MRTIQKTLILLGLVGILALLSLSAACGGNGNGDDGNGDEPAPTATSAGPTSTPAPAATSTPLSGVGGAPLPEEFTGGEEIAATASTTDMMPIGADGLGGTLDLIQIERQTKVTVILDDAGPGPYAAAVRRGGCPDEGGDPDGQFDYLLFSVEGGESVSMVNTPAQFFQFSLAYVIVVDGEDLVNDTPISCGNIPSPLR